MNTLLTQAKSRFAVSGHRFVLTIALGALVPGVLMAQSTVGYNFGTTTPVATHTSGTLTNVSEGSGFSIGNSNGTVSTPINTTSGSSGAYTGASGGENLGNAVKTGALSISTSSYYTLTLTPTSGYSLSLSAFSFGARSTSTGPTTYALYDSLDSYGTALFTLTATANSNYALLSSTLSFSDPTGAAVTFRLYTYGGAGNASSGTENNRIDDVSYTYTTATTGGGGTTTYQYYDLNGATAGSGAGGTTNTFSGHFNSASDGTGSVSNFTNDGTATATFSAGTDAAGTTYTVNIDQAVNTNGIAIEEGNVTLQHATGGSITLAGPSINVSNGATGVISEAIAGTMGLTKDGAGTLTLSGTNGYSGSTTIDNGILAVSADANLGSATNGVVLAGGTLQATTGFSTARAFTGTGSLDIAPSTTFVSTGVFNTTGLTLVDTGTLDLQGTTPSVGALTFNGAGVTVESTTGSVLSVGNITTAASTGTSTISAAINTGTTSRTVALATGTTLVLGGNLTGSGGIAKSTGAGTLDLNGNNSAYSGTLQIGGTATTGGTISLGSATALGTGTLNFNEGTLSNDTGSPITSARVLSIGAAPTSGSGATFAGSDLTFTGGVSFYSPAAATQVVTVNNHTTFSGTVATGSAASAGVLLNGTGTLTLTGNNTFVQPLTITGGTLEAAGAGSNQALGKNTALNVNTGGTLLFSTANQALTTAAVKLNTGTVSLANGASQGSGQTLSGGMITGGTNATGLGALTLAGNSTLAYTGTAATATFASFDPTNGGAAGPYTLNVTGSNFGTTTDSADGVNDRLIFDQDIAAAGYLGDITFNSMYGAVETELGTSGFYEITPGAPVPEPATVFGAVLMVGALGWSQRRRIGGLLMGP